MRRVLAVIPAPTYGGSANQVARLQAPLAELGWEYVPVIPDEPGNVAERLRAAGVEPVTCRMHRVRATADVRVNARTAAALVPDVRRLAELARRHDAAVVQNHGDLNPHAGIAGRLARCGVAWNLLDTRTPRALRRVTMQWVRRLADVVLTTGQALADQYPGVAAMGARQIAVYPPVDLQAFAPDPARRAAARAQLGIGADAFAVGTIGNRNPQKGQDALIRAAGAARTRRPELTLRILGATSPGHEAYERSLREAAAAAGLATGEGIAFADPGARVPELIQALDVLVVSSVPDSEGVPTVLLEAMACGIPCVATDVGAIREAVRDGEDGFVVPPLDDGALAAAIERMADPALRAAFGGRARARIARDHSLAATAAPYARGYELADERRRARAARRGRG